MVPAEVRHLTKVPVVLAEDLVKIIRLVAMTGRKAFITYLYEPLDFGGWKRRASAEQPRKLMERIHRALDDQNSIHTIGPLGKRLVSASMHDSLAAVGDGCIFFFEMMPVHRLISASREAVELVQILYDPLMQFRDIHQNKSEKIFEDALSSVSDDDLKNAFQPVDLDKYKIKVKLQAEAVALLEKIKIANRNNDMTRCRKLIAAYLIAYGDETLRVPVTVPNELPLPLLARQAGWLRLHVFAEAEKGQSFEEFDADLQSGAKTSRLVAVVRTPFGAEAKEGLFGLETEEDWGWGEVRRDLWAFTFHEFLPEGGFRSETLRFPESGRAFKRRQTRALRDGLPPPTRRKDELKEGSWQLDAAIPLMNRPPSITSEQQALRSAGWTLPVASVCVVVIMFSLGFAFAPQRTRE